jgi:hypothetical protein
VGVVLEQALRPTVSAAMTVKVRVTFQALN